MPKNDKNSICLVIGEDVELNDYVNIGAIDSIKIGVMFFKSSSCQ